MDSSKDELKATAANGEAASFTVGTRKRLALIHSDRWMWGEFIAEVSCTMMSSKVKYLKGKHLGRREEAVLIAAAADKVGNRFLLEEVCCVGTEQGWGEHWTEDSRSVNEEALGICLQVGLEDFCIGLVTNSLFDVPLWVVHRAGEHGFVQFLTYVWLKRVSVRTNTVIARMPWKVQRILRRKNRNKWPRFQANKPFLDFCDVLKWACLTQTEHKIRELVKNAPQIEDAAVAHVLITEGFMPLLEQMIEQEIFQVTPTGMLVLLDQNELKLAWKVIKVTNSHRIPYL